MQSSQQRGDNLYQLPSCTICLQDLSDQLASLACGHTFHAICIIQHFEYRGSCPLCCNRAGVKEIRNIHFRANMNTQANSYLRALLENLSTSEKKQMEELLKEFKLELEKTDKMQRQLEESEKELGKEKKSAVELRGEVAARKGEIETLRRENGNLERDAEHFRKALRESEKSEVELRLLVQKFQKQQNQFQQFKRYKKMMNENSQSLLIQKSQLQAKGTPPQEMVKRFFDMLQMKNLDLMKCRQRLKDYPGQIEEKDNQINMLKSNGQTLKKNLKDANERVVQQRKKNETLKTKCRALCEKTKYKDMNDLLQLEDSSRGTLDVKKPFSLLGEIQSQRKRPAFSQTCKIGGFGVKNYDKR